MLMMAANQKGKQEEQKMAQMEDEDVESHSLVAIIEIKKAFEESNTIKTTYQRSVISFPDALWRVNNFL